MSDTSSIGFLNGLAGAVVEEFASAWTGAALSIFFLLVALSNIDELISYKKSNLLFCASHERGKKE